MTEKGERYKILICLLICLIIVFNDVIFKGNVGHAAVSDKINQYHKFNEFVFSNLDEQEYKNLVDNRHLNTIKNGTNFLVKREDDSVFLVKRLRMMFDFELEILKKNFNNFEKMGKIHMVNWDYNAMGDKTFVLDLGKTKLFDCGTFISYSNKASENLQDALVYILASQYGRDIKDIIVLKNVVPYEYSGLYYDMNGYSYITCIMGDFFTLRYKVINK